MTHCMCGNINIGRVLIECIDSPPVWPTFPGATRKAILTSVVLGYIEWATSNGFKFLHLHVPPPQDCSNYILVRRSLNFRLRVVSVTVVVCACVCACVCRTRPGCILCHTIAMDACDDFDFGDPCAKAAQRTRFIVCILKF